MKQLLVGDVDASCKLDAALVVGQWLPILILQSAVYGMEDSFTFAERLIQRSDLGLERNTIRSLTDLLEQIM